MKPWMINTLAVIGAISLVCNLGAIAWMLWIFKHHKEDR